MVISEMCSPYGQGLADRRFRLVKLAGILEHETENEKRVGDFVGVGVVAGPLSVYRQSRAAGGLGLGKFAHICFVQIKLMAKDAGQTQQ